MATKSEITLPEVYFRHFASGDTSSKEIFARLQR